MTQAISDPRQASAALADLFNTHERVVFFGGALITAVIDERAYARRKVAAEAEVDVGALD